MIGKLRGTVDEIHPSDVILDVQGTGYRCEIPLPTYEAIVHNAGETVLYVHTWLREDQLRLYGFHTARLKELFEILIGVSGIGPSMALGILSALPEEELVEAVSTGNPALLVKVPGIGKAKAEKLVFDLKRKIKSLAAGETRGTAGPSVQRDAVQALCALGFEESVVIRSVTGYIADHRDAPVEQVIKGALKILSA